LDGFLCDFRVGFDACQDKFLFNFLYFVTSFAGGLIARCFASCILGWGADGAWLSCISNP
jgi:hypothetical protein